MRARNMRVKLLFLRAKMVLIISDLQTFFKKK